jgi:hypothetical protein
MQIDDLVACIDRGLSCYGENTRLAVYQWLSEEEKITPNEILSKPEGLVRAVKSTFGLGYHLAEHMIVKEIQRQFKQDASNGPVSLLEALESVQVAVGHNYAKQKPITATARRGRS